MTPAPAAVSIVDVLLVEVGCQNLEVRRQGLHKLVDRGSSWRSIEGRGMFKSNMKSLLLWYWVGLGDYSTMVECKRRERLIESGDTGIFTPACPAGSAIQLHDQ